MWCCDVVTRVVLLVAWAALAIGVRRGQGVRLTWRGPCRCVVRLRVVPLVMRALCWPHSTDNCVHVDAHHGGLTRNRAITGRPCCARTPTVA